MTPPKIDYQALGMVLTTEDAAGVLDITPHHVRDLMRSGCLGYHVLPDFSAYPKHRVRFHPDELASYQAVKVSGEVPSDKNNINRVQTVLREYLTDVPAETDYDEALEKGAPLWASTKQGQALHITVDSLVEFNRDTGGAPLVHSVVEESLEYLRALRKRGLVPMSDKGGRQRWGTWWRIPKSLLPEGDDDQTVREILSGVREPDERLRRSTELRRDDEDRPIAGTGVLYLDGDPLGT